KLATKFCDQGSRALVVSPIKCAAYHRRHDPRHRRYGYADQYREQQKQSAPETHGVSVDSQTFSKCHMPSGNILKSCTMGRIATALRTYSRGITRRDCKRLFSLAYKSATESLANFGRGNCRLVASSLRATCGSDDTSGIRTKRTSGMAGRPLKSSTIPASRAF